IRKYPHLMNFKDLEMAKLDIAEKVEQIISDNNLISICSVGVDSINIILNSKNKNIDVIPYTIKLINYINNNLNFQANISIGNAYPGFSSICTSFSEAEMCIKYSYIYPEKNIFTTSEAINWEMNSRETLRILFIF
ncbi:MAG: hypothetical protein GX754_11075, partial [Clostridiaceae bacterium]|nr:hypothetical protein [Clostridiaceae bacterium]